MTLELMNEILRSAVSKESYMVFKRYYEAGNEETATLVYTALMNKRGQLND